MTKKKSSYATVSVSKSSRPTKHKKKRIYVSNTESIDDSSTDTAIEDFGKTSSQDSSGKDWKYETSEESTVTEGQSDEELTVIEEQSDEELTVIEEQSSDEESTVIEEQSDEELTVTEEHSDEGYTAIEGNENNIEKTGPFGMAIKSPRKNKSHKSNANGNDIYRELVRRQLPDVPAHQKLNINDMKRICKYIETSIFDDDKCCIWRGYITNQNNTNKGTYVNFYFRTKKVALHRLLYSNFVAPLDDREYLKFNCDNKGICCNVNHYDKYKYSGTVTPSTKINKTKKSKRKLRDNIDSPSRSGSESEEFIIDFD